MTLADLLALCDKHAPPGWTLVGATLKQGDPGVHRLDWRTDADDAHRYMIVQFDTDADTDLDATIKVEMALASGRVRRDVARAGRGSPRLGQWVTHGNVLVTGVNASDKTATLSDGRTVKWEELRP